MKEYILADKRYIGSNVLVLRLAAAAGEAPLQFEAGQYVSISFQRHGRKTPVRSFSIISAPNDEGELEVAMRIEGSFTRAASEIAVNDVVYVQGPFGDFTVNEAYDKRIVMLAGGIGITPFMSILRWAANTHLATSITLLYGVRTQADIPFYSELVALQRQNPNFQVAFFVSNGAVVPEQGVNFVNSRVLPEHLEQLTRGAYDGITFFICGAKGFMKAQQQALADAGVREDRIITESFNQSSKLFSFGKGTPAAGTYAMAGGLLVLGILGIMLLDLFRVVPKLSAQSASSTNTTTPVTSTASEDSTEDSDTSSSAGTTVNSSSSNTASSAAPTTTTTSPMYSSPVSRVS